VTQWPRSRVGQYARRVGELLGMRGDSLELLELAAGSHFDPEVVEVFVRLVRANLQPR
jgi:HD-GYP domain-containing protein (c-di-GMP phosphodiesterase class II)